MGHRSSSALTNFDQLVRRSEGTREIPPFLFSTDQMSLRDKHPNHPIIHKIFLFKKS